MRISRFLELLEKFKQTDSLQYSNETNEVLFGFDDENGHTFLTSSEEDFEKGLRIVNRSKLKIHHVCVDGGLIEYGKEDYVGDGNIRGRFDSMIFSTEFLLLIEYKMKVSTDIDNNRWKKFKSAMNQIQECYLVLIEWFNKEGDSLNNYYSVDNIIPFVCMSKMPNLRTTASAQRNKELEKFRILTGGLKIQYGVEYPLNNKVELV